MARSVRNVLITGPVLQAMFFVTATRVDLPLEIFYLLFAAVIGLGLVLLLVLDPENPGLRKMREASDAYRAEFLQHQLEMGLGFGLALGAAFPFFGAFRGFSVDDVVTQVLFVGFVETLYLVYTVETMPYGHVVFPPLFGFAHEPVRAAWIHGQFTPESVAFFAYATAFGAVFMFLYAARDPDFVRFGRRRDGTPWNEYFGAGTSWTAHVVLNLLVLAFLLELLGLPLEILCMGC
jgi:hypothetical protein